MGAFGHGPIDTDDAMDMLYKIEHLIVRPLAIRKKIELYENEIRAAAEIEIYLGKMGYDCDLEIVEGLQNKLKTLLEDEEFTSEWNSPEEVKKSLRKQIRQLSTACAVE